MEQNGKESEIVQSVDYGQRKGSEVDQKREREM